MKEGEVISYFDNFKLEKNIMRVPKGSVWVEGDGEKLQSIATSFSFPVPQSLIIGKVGGVVYIIWSNNPWNLRNIQIYPTSKSKNVIHDPHFFTTYGSQYETSNIDEFNTFELYKQLDEQGRNEFDGSI